jgi:hypothetical protein
MDHLAFISALEKLAPFGVPGIMAFLWWLSIRSLKEAYAAQDRASAKILDKYEKVLDTYKDDLSALAAQYQVALKEMREKYDNNARLVEMFGALTERYGDLAEDAKKLIQTNIQCWQEAIDMVNKRAFCPYPQND